jgi:hypothetical protein
MMLFYVLRDDSRCVFRDIIKHQSFNLLQQAISNETVKEENAIMTAPHGVLALKAQVCL